MQRRYAPAVSGIHVNRPLDVPVVRLKLENHWVSWVRAKLDQLAHLEHCVVLTCLWYGAECLGP